MNILVSLTPSLLFSSDLLLLYACGAGSAYPSGVPDITFTFCWGSCLYLYLLCYIYILVYLLVFFPFLDVGLSVYFWATRLNVSLVSFVSLSQTPLCITEETLTVKLSSVAVTYHYKKWTSADVIYIYIFEY